MSSRTFVLRDGDYDYTVGSSKFSMSLEVHSLQIGDSDSIPILTSLHVQGDLVIILRPIPTAYYMRAELESFREFKGFLSLQNRNYNSSTGEMWKLF